MRLRIEDCTLEDPVGWWTEEITALHEEDIAMEVIFVDSVFHHRMLGAWPNYWVLRCAELIPLILRPMASRAQPSLCMDLSQPRCRG